MSVSRATEIERKYAVPDGAPLPRLDEVAGVVAADRRPTVTLEAVYFDTAERTLLGARIAVRRRTGGHDSGWHVKLRGADRVTELHAPIDPADPETLPAAFEAALRSRLRGRPLVPLARIRTQRTAVIVRDADGGGVEVVDDVVAATDVHAGVERSWREWEAEQAEDTPACADLLARVHDALIEAGGAESASPAKIAQALGRVGDPPAEPRADTAGAVLAERVAVHTEALHRGIQSLVLDGDEDGTAVHELRRTIRRARSLLAVEAVSGPAGAALRDRLGVLGRRLGEVRDPLVAARTVEALLAPMRAAPGHAAAIALLVDGPVAEQADLVARLADDLGAPWVLDLLAAVEGFEPDGPRALTAQPVWPALAERAVRRARRRARRAIDGDLEALHRARKAAKRARFVVAELQEAGLDLGKGLVRRARRDAQAQDVLGDHRDLALVLASLPAASERLAAAGGNAFALGRAAEDGERRLALLHLAARRAVRRLG